MAMMKNMAMVSMVMRDGLVRSRGTTAVERTAGADAPAAGTLFVGVGSPRDGPAWAVSACDAVLMASSRVSPRSSSWSSSPRPSSVARLFDLATWLGEGGREVRAGPWVSTAGPGTVTGLAWLLGIRCAVVCLPKMTSQWRGCCRVQRTAAALA